MARERYIVLLLGVESNPVPSPWHVQKELFILSKVNPKLQELFSFEKHYEGPYSQLLDELVKEPLIYENAYVYGPNGINLTSTGRRIYLSLRAKYKYDAKFLELLNALKLIRKLYDRLSKEQLLFLIYITHPEYVELSHIYDDLVRNTRKRRQLAESLLENGLVTEKRYKQLITQ